MDNNFVFSHFEMKKKDFHNFQKFFLHLTENFEQEWPMGTFTIFFYAQIRNVKIGLNNSVADPGFPRGGDTNPPGVVGGAQTYDFTNFSQNMHEIE